MTREKIVAYNDGVRAVLALANQSAAAMVPLIVEKPTRYNFAYETLLALAEEGLALLKDLPGPDEPTAPASPRSPIQPSYGSLEVAS